MTFPQPQGAIDNAIKIFESTAAKDKNIGFTFNSDWSQYGGLHCKTAGITAVSIAVADEMLLTIAGTTNYWTTIDGKQYYIDKYGDT
jgi:hypothetical protein